MAARADGLFAADLPLGYSKNWSEPDRNRDRNRGRNRGLGSGIRDPGSGIQGPGSGIRDLMESGGIWWNLWILVGSVDSVGFW
jgi:hypothetical protein